MGVFFLFFMDMKAPKYQQCQGNSPHQACSCGGACEEPEKAFLRRAMQHTAGPMCTARVRASEAGSREETTATKTKSAPSEPRTTRVDRGER